LRSPLNAILGFAQLMESDEPPPSPIQSESINQILNAGWYLLELINEILDLATIESGRLSMSLESVALDPVLSECRSMIEPLAQKRGIEMTFPDGEVVHSVRADRTRLKQIVINLLSNAIKYNSPRGSVTVACAVTGPGRVRISVTDTGTGLTDAKVGQLFQPFNRLGQEGSGEEGTGIGLVVSKRLAELMDGSIGAESAIGTGSTFWVELTSTDTAAQQPVALAPSAEPQPAGRTLRTVLCVEDSPANLLLVERVIARRPDLRLLTAPDGNRGVELARGCLPDVILMDINLPGISGTEAMKILRGDPLTSGIPIIAVSANAIPRDIQEGLDAGFFRYLTKPVKVAELLDAVNVALESVAGTANGR
jgi:CheY-like chemotaxis protein